MFPAQRPQLLTSRLAKRPVCWVVGAAGFLGAHLAEFLLKEDCQVVAIDNLKSGLSKNLEEFSQLAHFSFHQLDINQGIKDDLPSPDYLFHLAGVEEYLNGKDLSLATLLVNSLGTKNLLEAADKYRAKFLFVSTLDVYLASLSSLALAENFGVSERQTKEYTHHEAKRYGEALVTEYFKKKKLNARVVRVADVYGPKMQLNSGTDLNLLFKGFIEDEVLTVSGTGLKKLHPTYVTDVVEGIKRAMFLPDTEGQIFTLVNPQAVTVLNLSYRLQKRKSRLRLNFIAGKDEDELPFSLKPMLSNWQRLKWKPEMPLEYGLTKTIEWLEKKSKVEEKEVLADKEVVEPVEIKKPPILSQLAKYPIPACRQGRSNIQYLLSNISLPNGRFLTFGFSLLFLIIIILTPVLSLFYSTQKALADLKEARALVFDRQLEKAEQKNQQANKNFLKAQKRLNFFSPLLDMFKLRRRAVKLGQMLSIGSFLTEGNEHLFTALASGQELAAIFLGRSRPLEMKERWLEIKSELALAEEKYALVQAEIEGSLAGETEKVRGLSFAQPTLDLDNIYQLVISYRFALNKAGNLAAVLDQLMAVNGEKTYLVLFQNNMELRPGGGFIGSYGILTVKNGVYQDLTVNDVYSADGQLKGHLDPPLALRKYLGALHWYLRDSNFFADFSQNAQQAAWFLRQETDEVVDGVIGVDLYFLAELLKTIGPVELTDFQQVVNADNLFTVLHNNIESDFFPGSSQKRDILSSLSRQIMFALVGGRSLNLFSLAQALYQAAEEKHLLFYDEQKTIMQALTANNWTGNTDFAQRADDFVYLVEANLGGNKANFFVRREIDDTVSLGKEGEISHRLSLLYINNSTGNELGGGGYKNYLRLYLPDGSSLTGIEIDGESKELVLARGLAALSNPDVLEIDLEAANQQTMIGFLLNIEPQKTKQVTVNYRLDESLSLKKEGINYRLLIPKQPGTEGDNYQLVIEHPLFWQVINSPQEAVVQEGTVSLETRLNKDKQFNFSFEQ